MRHATALALMIIIACSSRSLTLAFTTRVASRLSHALLSECGAVCACRAGGAPCSVRVADVEKARLRQELEAQEQAQAVLLVRGRRRRRRRCLLSQLSSLTRTQPPRRRHCAHALR
jgi:hypothetical protein